MGSPQALIIASLLLMLPVAVVGGIAPGNSVMADNPRVLLPAPGASTAEVLLTLRSLSKIPTSLISVLTNAAAKVELHGPKAPESLRPSAPESLRPSAPGSLREPGPGFPGPVVSEVKVPRGATVKFAPGGFRIILKGIAPPLKAGDVVVLALVFDTVPGIIVRAPVSVGLSE